MTKKHKQLDDNYNITSKSSVYAKEVWNAAIEKAAKQADGAYGGLADEIRKLKV